MGESKEKGSKRFQRVVEILDAAQGDCVPDYQGYGAFWRDIKVLEKAELYGQRMIAPPEPGDAEDPNAPPKGSCCGGGGANANGADASGREPVQSPDPHDNEPAVRAVDLDAAQYVVNATCWPSGGSGGSGGGGSNGSSNKRSNRSGLIRGLRGEYPFDGNVFPALLWHAAHKVSESDIAYIAAWIDAGCPTTEEAEAAIAASESTVSVEANERLAYATGKMKHTVSERHVNDDAKDKKEVHKRKEISTLKPHELQRYRDAVECMSQYNHSSHLDERSWFHWARIHTNSCQHGWEQFLPWHRLYVYFFEQTLQDYDDRITVPYWSWSDYADANRNTLQTEQLDIGVIPEAFNCWLDLEGYNNLEASKLFTGAELKKLHAIIGKPYNSGRRFLLAAGLTYTLEVDKNSPPNNPRAVWSDRTRTIYNELQRANPLWFPNRWPGSTGTAAFYPKPRDIKAILKVSNWNEFGSGPINDHFFGALESVHNGMHNFSGGVNPDFTTATKAIGIDNPDIQNNENPHNGWMVDPRVTAYDPIFWSHHSNVDRLWAVWQELHPNVQAGDLDGVLAPWSMTVRDTLDMKKFGYEYVRDTYHYPTQHKNTAVCCFNSEKAGVRDSVLDLHRKAEVRLHRVQRGNLPNAIVRAFLNTPDASPDTPTEGNDCFVGQVATFHGSCYGGPGHCDLPLPKTRPFDRRTLHHHEPRNFRLDATECVQKMVAKGETDLSVHLVVVGLDGKPKDDAIFMDGVSLNFFD